MYREPGPSLSANPTWTLQQWDDANRQLRDQIDTLRGYEYDRREPLVGTVAKMVAVIGVSLDELAGLGKDPARKPAKGKKAKGK
jgi:hypothetical protein